MSQEIIFVLRHAERMDYVDRQWKAKYPECALDDPPLAPKGHKQAEEVAQRLANESIDRIITSPYLRCVETANFVAEKLNKPILVEPGLCEVLWDEPGFKSTQDLQRRFPAIDPSYEPILPRPPPFESTDDDCIARVVPVARQIRERFRGSRTLMIGHGASVAGILKAFTGAATYVGLCTVSKLVNRGSLDQPVWKAEYVGDTSHLSDKTNLRPY